MSNKSNCIECLYYNFIDRTCKTKHQANSTTNCAYFFKIPDEEIYRRKRCLDKIAESNSKERNKRNNSIKYFISALYLIPIVIFLLYIIIASLSDPSATFNVLVLDELNIFIGSYIIIFIIHLMLITKL